MVAGWKGRLHPREVILTSKKKKKKKKKRQALCMFLVWESYADR